MPNSVGFIGFGRMGQVIARRALEQKRLRKNSVSAYAPSAKTRSVIRKLGVHLSADVADVVKRSYFVWLCVKPQRMNDVLAELKSVSRANKCFVSVAAGVPIERFEKALGPKAKVLRVMPNTPSLLGAGMAAISRGRYASKQDEATVKIILSSLGEVVSVPEKWMHAVTAVSGSGPAYVFTLAEAMVAAGKKLGLSDAVAERLVRQTVFGAGRMLRERMEPAAELRRQVTSPGGTTEAALKEFERRGFNKAVQAALERAVKRSKELSRLK